MMCSIRKCKSRSIKGGSIMFFSFPKDQSVANEWLRHCGPKTTAKHGRVCSKHFLPSDYSKPLRCILLNYSPKHSRQLKADAIPTLHLDSIDKQNTSKVTINVKNEIINTTENMNGLPQCNIIPANEVTVSSEVTENRLIKDKQNTPKVKIEIHTTENMNSLPQCTTIPTNGVVGLYKAVEERTIKGEQNTPNVTVEGENTIIITAENMNCLPQFITIPANEAAGSSEVIENRPIKDKQNTPNVKAEIEIVHNTENMDCLPQSNRSNIIPANEVAGLYKVLVKRPINDKQNTPNVTVKRENGIILTAENMNSLSQFITIPANEAAGSSKVNNKSDETITISLAEHKAFIRNTNELKNLKNNLSKMFTSGQIRCLTNPTRHRVKWTAEDIAAAISLQRKSPQAYRFMRVTVGIPLPGFSTLRKWTAKHKNHEMLLDNVVKIDHTYAD